MSSNTNVFRTPDILTTLGPPSAFTRAQVKRRNEADDDCRSRTGFFDLPPELRNVVYSFICSHRWVDINVMSDKIMPPVAARVSRLMRQESLDLFYGRCVWSHDMRTPQPYPQGVHYPQSWKPTNIFVTWITAIGDENAARIKRLRFYHHNFILLITVNDEQPRISYKFRTNQPGTSTVSTQGPTEEYRFPEAFRRAGLRLASIVSQVNREVGEGPLTVHAIRNLYAQIEAMKPTLCSRSHGLGFEGAIYDESGQGGPFETHLSSCKECAYLIH